MLAFAIGASDLNILTRVSECHDRKYIQLVEFRNECCASDRKRTNESNHNYMYTYLKRLGGNPLKIGSDLMI